MKGGGVSRLHPIGAGTILYAMLRMLFTLSRQHPYKMQAGNGDNDLYAAV